MQSLSDLNAHSRLTLEVVDQRPANVVFDRFSAKDQFINVTSTTPKITTGIEIEEVINYQKADCKYRLSILSPSPNPLTGSTINWNNLPEEVELTIDGDIYTLSGIKSRSIWQQIKVPNWTLPNDYDSKPLWFLRAEIIYFNEGGSGGLITPEIISYDIIDLDYYYLAILESESSMNIIPLKVKQSGISVSSNFIFEVEQGNKTLYKANLVSKFESNCIGNFINAKLFESNMVTQSQLSIEIKRFKGITRNISSIFSVSTSGNVFYGSPKINSNTASTMITSARSFSYVYNVIPRTWLSNQPNNIFSINTPFVEDESLTYNITISVESGLLGTGTSGSSSISRSGNKSTINAWFPTIIYYPIKGSVESTTYTFTINVNAPNVPTITITMPLDYVGAGTIGTNIYTFNTSGNNTWTPSFVEKIYAQLDYILVGGGGGGGGGFPNTNPSFTNTGNAGAGGAAGSAISGNLTSITQSSYSLFIGAGGTGGQSTSTTRTAGNPGGNTTGFGQTALGGNGGGRGGSYNSGQGSVGGNNSNYNGSEGTNNNSIVPWAGGGGAGSGGNGQSLSGNNQTPRSGGARATFDFANAGTGGQGGTGYRPEIGANGSGQRGADGTGVGYGGGGGGGYSVDNLSQSPGSSGGSGAVYIRTRP